ncbi:MAG: protein kinase [Planctomycetes bacterium]|nr:protein kinase [Planctomycetota bacterium]
MTESQRPGSRLERALEAFLAEPPGTAEQAERLLSRHPDLHDVLAPMLGGVTAGADGDDDGQSVLGDFRLVREIGRGGMGVVYEAWQRSLDRRVAVKVLPPGLVDSPAAIARFRREAAAAARLQHPHIVEVHGFGSDRGRHFFAMQFVDGRPLHACMDDWRSPARAVALATQLAAALAHAHAAGLVHRDVKPANVLVDTDGDALLTDFGVARDEAQPSLTREGGFVGTLDYAAPEQLRGDRVDGRADVWSLGVVLYELLAGVRPFAAPTQQALLHAIHATEPQSLLTIDGVTRDLAAIVDRALQKDPARRYASAEALLQDLRALQSGAPVTARLPSTGERLLRWARREPWRAFAAVFACVAVPLLAATGGYLWANAPRIRAAKADEQRRDRDARLARATFERTEGHADLALATLAPLPDGDPEVDFARATLLHSLGQKDAARALLQPRPEPCLELVRRTIDGDAPPAAELRATTGEPFDAYVRAMLAFEIDHERRTRTHARQNAPLLEQAMLLADRMHASLAVRYAMTALRTIDPTALRRAEQILAAHFPDDPTSLRVRAMLQSEFDAEAALQWIAALPPDATYAAALLSARGRAHERLDDIDRAEADYRAALALDDQRSVDWANLGNVLRKRQRFDEAIDALQRARTLRPQDPVAANQLALALRDVGRIDEAEALFTELVETARDYAPAAYNLGNLRMRRGDVDGAVLAFQRAVEIDGDDVRHLANLGDALARVGRRQESLAISLRAAERAPNSFVVQYNVARTALDLGLAELALPAARRAQAAGGEDPRGFDVLAETLLAQKIVDGPAVLAAAREADQRRNGKDIDTRIRLARALGANGDLDGARRLLTEAKAATRFAAAADQSKLDHWLQRLAER